MDENTIDIKEIFSQSVLAFPLNFSLFEEFDGPESLFSERAVFKRAGIYCDEENLGVVFHVFDLRLILISLDQFLELIFSLSLDGIGVFEQISVFLEDFEFKKLI